MPQELVEQRVLSNLAVKHSKDEVMARIKMNHFGYITSLKPAKTVGLLLMLLDDCLEWLTQHPSAGYFDDRPKVIHKLLKAVITQVKSGVDAYTESVTLAARTGTKSLAEHYTPELANFYKVQRGDKGDEKAGFHTMMAYRNASQHYRMLGNLKKGLNPEGMNPARYKLLVENSGAIKPSELVSNPVFLSRMVDTQASDDLVAYMRKHTRMKFQIFFVNHKLLRRHPDILDPTNPAHLQPLTCEQWIYAASEETEPKFFCVDDQDPKLMQMTGNVQLNHSSFLKGRPCMCAGTLIVEDGDLVWINNNSGHYQPTWKQVHNLAKFLDSKGAITAKTRLVFFDPVKAKYTKGDRTYELNLNDYEFDAREFLERQFYALPYMYWDAMTNKKVAPYAKSTRRADLDVYVALLKLSGKAEFMEVNPTRLRGMHSHARQRGFAALGGARIQPVVLNPPVL